MRLPDKYSLFDVLAKAGPLALIASLVACGGGSHPPVAMAPAAQGPAADYPVVVGDPFTIDGVTFTPTDGLNYDEVGYSSLEDQAANSTISAVHRTLPLPSYAEVTSLETGQTILVRVERRGPMDGPFLIALSSGAAHQLGVTARTPVRVRRVNPPEQERAMLRRGEAVPKRMETPASLVDVLKRNLPAGGNSTSIALPEQKPISPMAASDSTSAASELIDIAPSSSIQQPDERSMAVREPAPAQDASVTVDMAETEPASSPGPAPKNGFVAQAGAYSTSERAQRVADGIGGFVEKSGKLWLVRTGPFSTRKEAQASLAKVVGKGYSDARIYRTD
jgi:rare lipoprotein A